MRTRLLKALAIIILPVAVLLLTLPAATALAGPSATDPTSLSTDVTSSTTDAVGDVTSSTTDAVGDVTSSTTDAVGDVTSSTTDAVGDVTSSTTDAVGDVTSSTTDAVGDVTSSTTDAVGDVTQPESPPDGSASPGSPTAGTDTIGVPEESVTAIDAGGTFGGPPTPKASDDPTAPMPPAPLRVLANRGPVRTGRPTAAMSAQPICGVVNLHRDGGVLSMHCTEDPASHGSAVLGLLLAATGAGLLLLVALALGFSITGSGLLTAERRLGRTSSAAVG